MSEQTIRVLLLDDEESLRKPLSDYLHNTHGFSVEQATDGAEALRLVKEAQGHYDVALLDQVLTGEKSGLDVLREIKADYPDIAVILFTGWGMTAGMEALRTGAYRYIAKPFDKDELAMTIRFAAEQKRLRRERDYMAALVKASEALTRTTNLDEQLKLVWDFVREQLATPTCFIALYANQFDTLSFPIFYEKGVHLRIESIHLGNDPASWCLAGYVVKKKNEQVWFTSEQAQKRWKDLGIMPGVTDEGPSESGICLPLLVGDEVLGALSVQSYKPHAFDQALLNAVRALGNQVAVALENGRLMTETEQKARNLGTLQNLTVAINSTLELKQVLTQTCQAAVELTEVDHSGLVLFDPDGTAGQVLAEYPPTERTLGQRITVRGIPAEEQLVLEKQIVNIPDLASDTSLGTVRDLLLGLGIRSIVIVPVVFDGKVVASFSLDAMQNPRAFSQGEIEICQSLANQAAVAIRNARLYQETDEGRRYLHSLYQATTEIISPRDPNEVLQNIVNTVCGTTGAWRAVILLVDESEHPLAIASFGFDHHLDLAESIRPNGVSTQVFRSGQPRFIPDTEAEANKINPAMLTQGTKAAACLPLSLLGRNIGVLWIQFRDKHTFSKTEQQALQLYANQSAIAYDNSRRMRELEQLKNAAEAMASKAEWKDVLQEIAKSAKQVLEANYTLIWPYDAERKIFFPEDLVAENVQGNLLEEFRKVEPETGKTTERVLERGYVKVEDLPGEQPDFLGDSTRDFLKKLKVIAFQGIRLDVAGEPLGVLYVDYKHARGFSKEDCRILEHFANQAALTLKKARLLKQVRRSQAAARAIAQVGASGNLSETLNATVRGARDVLGCNIATLYTFDEQKQQFIRSAGVGCRYTKSMRSPDEITSDSALWKIIHLQDKQYHPAEDILDDELLYGNFAKSEEVQSALGIQLRFGERRVGVMFVNYRTPHRFTQDEIDDALLFANQAAVAIHNAQLYEEIQKRAKVMEGLYEASKAITSTLTLEEVLMRIAERALSTVGADPQDGCFSHIALLEGSKLRFIAGFPTEIVHDLRQNVGEIDLEKDKRKGIVGEVILTRQSKNETNTPNNPNWIPLRPGVNINSQLSVLLHIGAHVIGVLSIEHPNPSAFSDEDVQNVEALAAQAAMAIENAKEYKNVETMLAARTALAWTGMIGSTWRHAVEKHALTIREQVQLLRQDAKNLPKIDSLDKRVTMIERLANQILERPLTPPLSAEEGVVSLPINDFLRERTRQLWAHEPYKLATPILDLKLDDSASVRASPEWLRRAFDILVDNAVEATVGMTERKIVIGSQRRDNYAEISITDNGHGIPDEVLERLFREPIKKTKGEKGQGIGLLLTQTIVQTYGGSISCSETGPTGTTMVIALPLEM